MNDLSMQKIWRAMSSINKAIKGQAPSENLVDALESALSFIEHDTEPTDPELCAERDEAISLARAALAKARGES